MPQEKHPKRALLARANGKRPDGRPRTIRWTNYTEMWDGVARDLIHSSEMIEVMEERKVWLLNLELLPSQPSRKSEQWRNWVREVYNPVRADIGANNFLLRKFQLWKVISKHLTLLFQDWTSNLLHFCISYTLFKVYETSYCLLKLTII